MTTTKTRRASREEELERLRLCVHEAGHAVWAVLSGCQVTDCFVKSGSGRVDIEEETPYAAEIAYAGIWAGTRFAHSGLGVGGSAPTRSQLIAALAEASPEDLEKFGGRPTPLWQLDSDLEFLIPRIHELAFHIFKHGSATHADVERVLGITTGLTAAACRNLIRHRIDPATVTPAGVAA